MEVREALQTIVRDPARLRATCARSGIGFRYGQGMGDGGGTLVLGASGQLCRELQFPCARPPKSEGGTRCRATIGSRSAS